MNKAYSLSLFTGLSRSTTFPAPGAWCRPKICLQVNPDTYRAFRVLEMSGGDLEESALCPGNKSEE